MMMSDREQLKEVTVLYSKTVKTVVLWVGVEYCENFLRKSRSEHNYRNLHGESQTLNSRDLTSFAYQVCLRLSYV